MFAIVRLGNQQFKVQAGDFIRSPFQDKPVQGKIDIPVVAFSSGEDFLFDSSELKGSKVTALVLRQSLAPKVLILKKKRRKGYRRTQGHRQKITELRILELKSPGGQVSKVDLKKQAVSKTKTSSVKDRQSVATAAQAPSVQVKTNVAKKAASKTATVKTVKPSHKKIKKQAARTERKSAGAKSKAAVKSKKKTKK